jgi:hypothetical protein
MDLKRLADKAKQLVDKRGGTDSLKGDASELKDIATGQGSLTDKAKAAAEAIKDPGEAGEQVGQRVQEEAPDEPPAEAGGERSGGGRGQRGQGRRRRRGRGV